VLARSHRLTSGEDFRHVLRRGRRCGSATLVVHLAAASGDADQRPPRVGFAVSRAVGVAVVRNRVKRRLRHLMRERLAALPAGSTVVVRALPAAAAASYADLAADLDACLGRATAGGAR
jgi:ribonuclease P protein component